MRRARKWLWIVGLILPALIVGMAFGEQKDTIKAAFIYIGPITDQGWTYAHELSRQYAESQLDYLETAYTENVNPADAARVIRGYCEQDYDIIFTTSFELLDGALEVAKDYPNIVFEQHAGGYESAENVGRVFARLYQPYYLAGIAAGAMTESNLIGYVAAHPIPQVIREINAFAKGIQVLAPDAVVKVIFVNTWFDPAKEREAAEALVELGADVLCQTVDSPATQQVAQEHGIYSVACYADQRQFAPDANIASAVFDWGPATVRTIEAVRNGTWVSQVSWDGYEAGEHSPVQLTPLADFVPAAVPQ